MSANRSKHRKPPSSAWKPGQSGNPSGRPKEVGEIRELARQHTAASIRVLAAGLKDENGRTRIAAAEVLLDRGWGKATQHIEANINVIDQLSVEDKRALLEALAALPGSEEPADEPASTRH